MAMGKYNQAKADAFANAMLGHLNGAALALMASLGHRTGLFDTMATMPHAIRRKRNKQ